MGNGRAYQILMAVASAAGSLSLGLLYVWPSYTLPMLAASNGTILDAPLTTTEEAMLGALPSLGALVGSALVGMAINTFGRKMANILTTLLYMISWTMIGFTRSIAVVLIARFLGGVAGGLTCVITPIYISEVAEDHIRGILASFIVVFYQIGTLISYFIGWYCSYHAIVWINLAIPIVRILMFLCVPESPVYLMKKNRVEAARHAISVYRGVSPNSATVDRELSKIKEEICSSMPLDLIKDNGDDAEKMKLNSEDYSYKDTFKPNRLAALKMLCKSPSSRRAFIVVFISFSMEILMGAAPVAVYAKQVFIEADPTRGDMWSVVFAVMNLLGTMLSGVVSDRAGRRPLLIIASLVVSICLLALGVLLQTKVAPAWVGVLVLMTFCFCFMAGPGTIPYVLMSEIFCPEVQTLASMLIIEWVWLLAFFTLAVFHWLNRLIGIHATFYIFTFNSLFNVAFSYYMIPETKGLSNKEIQIALLKGRSK